MSDQAVSEILRSKHPVVLIEAPAGCGKTFQGAAYATDIAGSLGTGRVLILTHTHAACSVFAERTREMGRNVEIRTIDALIAQIAVAYHKPLGLPADPSVWAWQDNGKGFGVMAAKVAAFLNHQPMVAKALARRHPVIICDEHQDSSVHQHAVVMALHNGGAMLRIFGDPMQRIYRRGADERTSVCWEALKRMAAVERLDDPHRWENGCPELGKWILTARERLQKADPIDLTGSLPPSLRVIECDNISQRHDVYQLSARDRRPIDELVNNMDQLMVLASQNAFVRTLRAFWNRSIPLWEGHTRGALIALVTVLRTKPDDPEALAAALVDFVSDIAVGFSKSSHGDRLLREVREGCQQKTRGKPACLQAIAQRILDDPHHTGVSNALGLLRSMIARKESGFDGIKIDHPVEFNDAVRLGSFASADEGFAEIARKRSHSRPAPPARVLSSIHKAKGLECDNVLLVGCDKTHFSKSTFARSKLYVALSRAKTSLTLVIPRTNVSPLFTCG